MKILDSNNVYIQVFYIENGQNKHIKCGQNKHY